MSLVTVPLGRAIAAESEDPGGKMDTVAELGAHL
jgi:hypothetical protein